MPHRFEVVVEECIGMQVIAEGLAMGSFKRMKEITGDEVLRKIFELALITERTESKYREAGLAG